MYDLSFKNRPALGQSSVFCVGNPLKDRLFVCKARDIQDSSGPFDQFCFLGLGWGNFVQVIRGLFCIRKEKPAALLPPLT